MFSKKWQILTTLALMLMAIGIPMAHADLYWETEQITRGVQGQPPGPVIMKHYYTSNASRTELGDGKITITDFATKNVYQIDPATKSYSVTNLDQMGGAQEMEDMPAEARKMMESMMGSIKITPTNETKTISGYNCRKYLVNVMMSSSESWVSKDVKGLDEMRSIAEKMSQLYEGNPMLKQMNMTAMTDQLDGFPVQTVTQFMGGTIINTLVRIEQKSLSSDLFKIPAGYTQKAEE